MRAFHDEHTGYGIADNFRVACVQAGKDSCAQGENKTGCSGHQNGAGHGLAEYLAAAFYLTHGIVLAGERYRSLVACVQAGKDSCAQGENKTGCSGLNALTKK